MRASASKLIKSCALPAMLLLASSPLAHRASASTDDRSPPADPIPYLGPKPFIGYFRPTPLRGPIAHSAWGADTVGPRDQQNGLEDVKLAQWNYWDGQILKGADGKYRMFGSRWEQSQGHDGWKQSLAIWSKSDDLLGPYRDMGLTWPDNEHGLGHNVTALRLSSGRYAILVSETRQGDVFTSDSIDGPWKQLGHITVDQGAFKSLKTPGDTQQTTSPKPWHGSNLAMIERPDGGFQIIQRSGQILISPSSILGPYKIMGDSIYRALSGLPQTDMRAYEDPALWFSGGWYHVLVNHWRDRRAYHLISRDGITGWKLQGLAYEPNANFIRLPNGTANHWFKLERPGVYMENGHVMALTFAVVDIPKEAQKGNDGHGSKIIVVPFDGKAMDRDLSDVN